jgi:hypothetical protein
LIGIGHHRTSTIAVSELITSDNLTEHDALLWLVKNEELWSHSGLPILVKRDIRRVLEQKGLLAETERVPERPRR